MAGVGELRFARFTVRYWTDGSNGEDAFVTHSPFFSGFPSQRSLCFALVSSAVETENRERASVSRARSKAESGKATMRDRGRCATVADPLGVQRPARSNIETRLARRDGSRKKNSTLRTRGTCFFVERSRNRDGETRRRSIRACGKGEAREEGEEERERERERA